MKTEPRKGRHCYVPAPIMARPERRWPDRTITKPPIWCSVDLRDGNQALALPMGLDRKRRFFELLLSVGFREIEVGYPAASQIEWDFVRELVEGERVPEGVRMQVLTAARPELIARTMDAVEGARGAIIHLYNSTSTVQRRVVFEMDRAGVKDLAVRGATQIRERAERMPDTAVTLQYSPESYTGTEDDFALEICEAVADVWEPCDARPMIVNLPATVEMTMPNVFADRIEWFGDHFSWRDVVTLSVHPHNDRGTAVAAAELAVLAGADRVEGTLFGNGERTGNVDLVTLALNLHTQGVDPGLDFGEVDAVVAEVEHCNRMPVPARHPYAGELVYTAFSGTHQDAVKKGLAALENERLAAPGRTETNEGEVAWDVPYLPIDPADLGRSYEEVIRVNAQSGKGGIAYLMERDHGVMLPRFLQVDFARHVQRIADANGDEITSRALGEIFERTYFGEAAPAKVLEVETFSAAEPGDSGCRIGAWLELHGRKLRVEGVGRGPLDAWTHALASAGVECEVVDYEEQALGAGAGAFAMASVEVERAGGARAVGVGRGPDIVRASLDAIVRAVADDVHGIDRATTEGGPDEGVAS